MKIKNIKSNRGISMVDVVAAILILSMFVGVIGNLYYNILYQSNLIRYNAIAVYYSIKIAEDIDKMAYNEVTEDLNETLKEKYSIPDFITMKLYVEDYKKDDPTKQDIIKTVRIEAQYKCFEDTRTYKISKLKISEKGVTSESE